MIALLGLLGMWTESKVAVGAEQGVGRIAVGLMSVQSHLQSSNDKAIQGIKSALAEHATFQDFPDPCLQKERCRFSKRSALSMVDEHDLHVLMIFVPAPKPKSHNLIYRPTKSFRVYIYAIEAFLDDCSPTVRVGDFEGSDRLSEIAEVFGTSFWGAVDAVSEHPECAPIR